MPGLIRHEIPWGQTKPPYGTPVDPQHPLARGLSGVWLMNDGAGQTIYDVSDTENDGAFVNAPLWKLSGTGEIGLSFLRTSSRHVVFPVLPFQGRQGRAVSVRFATTDTTTGGANCLLSLDVSGGNNAGLAFVINCENGVVWLRTGGGVTGNWGSGYNDAFPHRIVMTFPANGTISQVKCWVDGHLLSGTFASGSTVINTNSGNTFWLGGTVAASTGGASYFFNGTLFDVETWEYQLSDDVAGFYSNDSEPFCFMEPDEYWLASPVAAITFNPAWAVRASEILAGGLAA